MLTTKNITAIVATAILSTGALAAQTNPLHPSFNIKNTGFERTLTAAERYLDTRNPLHPTFGNASGEWLPTASQSTPYVDSRNPLHPSYRIR